MTALKHNIVYHHGPQIATNMWPIPSDYRYEKMCRLVVQALEGDEVFAAIDVPQSYMDINLQCGISQLFYRLLDESG